MTAVSTPKSATSPRLSVLRVNGVSACEQVDTGVISAFTDPVRTAPLPRAPMNRGMLAASAGRMVRGLGGRHDAGCDDVAARPRSGASRATTATTDGVARRRPSAPEKLDRERRPWLVPHPSPRASPTASRSYPIRPPHGPRKRPRQRHEATSIGPTTRVSDARQMDVLSRPKPRPGICAVRPISRRREWALDSTMRRLRTSSKRCRDIGVDHAKRRPAPDVPTRRPVPSRPHRCALERRRYSPPAPQPRVHQGHANTMAGRVRKTRAHGAQDHRATRVTNDGNRHGTTRHNRREPAKRPPQNRP